MPNAPVRSIKHWHNNFRPFGYRVGYCPLVFNEEYAIAKTFLPPGYSQTPERELINNKISNLIERQKLIAIAGKLDFYSLRNGEAMDLIKWFHDNGVPQVIDPPSALFDKEYLSRKIGAK